MVSSVRLRLELVRVTLELGLILVSLVLRHIGPWAHLCMGAKAGTLMGVPVIARP